MQGDPRIDSGGACPTSGCAEGKRSRGEGIQRAEGHVGSAGPNGTVDGGGGDIVQRNGGVAVEGECVTLNGVASGVELDTARGDRGSEGNRSGGATEDGKIRRGVQPNGIRANERKGIPVGKVVIVPVSGTAVGIGGGASAIPVEGSGVGG